MIVVDRARECEASMGGLRHWDGPWAMVGGSSVLFGQLSFALSSSLFWLWALAVLFMEIILTPARHWSEDVPRGMKVILSIKF
jgi:hypothetical protein